MQRLFPALAVLWIACSPKPQVYTIPSNSNGDIHAFFHFTPGRGPLPSAHRGGPVPGYPENCIATFQHTVEQTYALIECDVYLTSDDSLVMMHDKSLNRTSTGIGRIVDHTYSEIRELRLRDDEGELTDYGVPSLHEVLTWARGKTVIMLDIKGVPPSRIVRELHDHNGTGYVVVITYNATEAQTYARLDSSLMISCNIERMADYDRLIEFGVKPENMVAFCGISEPDKSLYEFLHAKGIYCQLGTMGNLDKKAEANGDRVYEQLLANGADILSTDRHEVVWRCMKRFVITRGIHDSYLRYE